MMPFIHCFARKSKICHCRIDPNPTEKSGWGRGVPGVGGTPPLHTPIRRFVPQLWTRVDALLLWIWQTKSMQWQYRQWLCCDACKTLYRPTAWWKPLNALTAGSSRFRSRVFISLYWCNNLHRLSDVQAPPIMHHSPHCHRILNILPELDKIQGPIATFYPNLRPTILTLHFITISFC